MKKTFTGWVPKEFTKPGDVDSEYNDEFFWIFKSRGMKSDWPERSWPPKKVKITIELIP